MSKYPSVRMKITNKEVIESINKELEDSTKQLHKQFEKCKFCKHFKWVEYLAPKSWLVECELEVCPYT